MPNDKNPDQLVADSMTQLFSGLGSATVNPLATRVIRPITKTYRITGVVCWEDTGEPAVGMSIGLGGQEAVTNERGEFVLTVTKKSKFPNT